MQNILIAGAGSYIGSSVENWLKKYSDAYEINVLDMIGDSWKEHEFLGHDVVYLVAGIAHRLAEPIKLYDDVNHKMAVEIFKRCVDSNVKQFIFMSSGAVYTQSDKKNRDIVITSGSHMNPTTAYGKSKLDAERDITAIKKQTGSPIKVAILRPPMVYGKGAKGNYQNLAKIAMKLPVFPKIKNRRSMIYIDNLCEFIRLIIDESSEGIFLPQNKEYANTCELIRLIRQIHGKKTIYTSLFNWAVDILSKHKDIVNKAFGSYIYKKEEFRYFNDQYQVVNLEESLRRTEL